MSWLYFGFSSHQKTGLFNEFFATTSIEQTLEGQDHCAVGAVCSFSAVFTEGPIGCLDSSVLISIHTLYPDIFNALLFKTFASNTHTKPVSSAQEKLDALKRE